MSGTIIQQMNRIDDKKKTLESPCNDEKYSKSNQICGLFTYVKNLWHFNCSRRCIESENDYNSQHSRFLVS